MSNLDKMKLMCDKFIDSDELNYETLLEVGFHSVEINELINKGVLRKKQNGFFELCDSTQMIDYSNYLIRNNGKKRASKALFKALDISPDDGLINLKVFSKSIFKNDFKQALSSLQVLMKTDNDCYLHEQNLWLYLLSFLIELPEEYKIKVKNMKYDDVCILERDGRYKSKNITNTMIKLIMINDFIGAIKLAKKTKEFAEKRHTAIITDKLLHLAYSAEKRDKKEYNELIESKKYSELLNKFNDKSEIRELSYFEKCLFAVVKDIDSIINNKVIPKKMKCGKSEDIYSLLRSKQYEEALMLNQRYRETYHYSNDRLADLLRVIIEEKNKLIKRRENADKYKNEITSNLKNNNVVQVISDLDIYLELLDKKEYKQFIISLIKLDFLDDNKDFSDTLFALDKIDSDKCEFDLVIYIHSFYFALANNDLKRAKIYLDIISMSSFIGNNDFYVENMDLMFSNKLTELGLKESDLIVNFSKVEDNIEDKFCFLVNILSKVIDEKGIAMLEPLSLEEIRKVTAISNQISCIDTLVVDEKNGMKRIFFKYANSECKNNTKNKAISLFNQLYEFNDFDGCIDLYEEELFDVNLDKKAIYTKVGMSYYLAQEKDIIKAIDYLTLASAYSNSEYDDVSKLLQMLKENSSYDGIKINDGDSDNKRDSVNSIQYKKENNYYT